MGSTDRDDSSGSFLRGVRVIEIADELGEYCGKVLAGLGADVVKIEPIGGESTRRYGPFLGDEPDPDCSLYFWHYNFGKRSVVLDLEDAAGRAAFEKLLVTADVLLDTRPLSCLADLGLGYERLSELNPGLIYARVSPFGDSGPWANFQANDLVHLALGGMVMNCGYDANLMGEYDTPPVAPQMWHAYHVAGEMTAIHIVAALSYRLVSGVGQQLSTSVHEAVSANTEQDTPDWIYTRQPHVRRTCGQSAAQTVGSPLVAARRAATEPTIMRTKDGRWLLPYTSYIKVQGTVKAGQGDAVDRLVAIVKDSGADDDYIAGILGDYTDPARRERPEFVSALNILLERFIARTQSGDAVWLKAQELGLAWAPILRPDENVANDHWEAREAFIEVDHRGLGTFTEVGAKWVAPGLPWRTGPAAPRVGEHTAEVLADLADGGAQPGPGPYLPERRRQARTSALGKPFALTGVRVIDISWALASAGAGRYLAALGAEVIKVEHESKIDGMRRGYGRAPEGGRAERDRATAPIAVPFPEGLNRSGAFMEINAGKLGISLDLKSDEGKDVLRRLLGDADIVIEGFSPGTFERMGFGYEVLKQIKKDIVYVQQSGMGERGVYGRLRTFGPSAQALSGLSDMSGLAEPYGPAGIGYSYLDWFGAYQMALAMMAGLYRRERTGEGCWIDSAQVQAGIYLTGTATLDYSANGRRWQRRGNRAGGRPAAPHGIYRGLGHERWIAVAAHTEHHWKALVEVVGDPAWAFDERLVDLQRRDANRSYLDGLMSDAVSKRDVFELMRQLQERGVPAGVCQTAEDRCEHDPQLKHLGWMTELTQSEIGTWPVKGVPTKMSATPPYIGGLHDRHGPSYGEDTAYVLSTIAGISAAEQGTLRDRGVI
ncbi:MAG TPA: CoA transferase [Solirubrobacteraceae bacterium]|jgi:crotonobetainyl-CoA:carnitine CoA-transferase CaiB-like acyl-CoA transferase|nr:CoA transferase [Solirubrobacteraceae bacterium]